MRVTVAVNSLDIPALSVSVIPVVFTPRKVMGVVEVTDVLVFTVHYSPLRRAKRNAKYAPSPNPSANFATSMINWKKICIFMRACARSLFI